MNLHDKVYDITRLTRYGLFFVCLCCCCCGCCPPSLLPFHFTWIWIIGANTVHHTETNKICYNNLKDRRLNYLCKFIQTILMLMNRIRHQSLIQIPPNQWHKKKQIRIETWKFSERMLNRLSQFNVCYILYCTFYFMSFHLWLFNGSLSASVSQIKCVFFSRKTTAFIAITRWWKCHASNNKVNLKW